MTIPCLHGPAGYLVAPVHSWCCCRRVVTRYHVFSIFKLPPLHMQAYTILQPGSTDLQKHHKCLRALHVQMLTWMGKSLPEFCAPKAKLPPFSYWFLAKVSPIFENTERMKKIVQLQKSGAVFQPGRISSSATLYRSSHMGKIIKECDTWCLLKCLK